MAFDVLSVGLFSLIFVPSLLAFALFAEHLLREPSPTEATFLARRAAAQAAKRA